VCGAPRALGESIVFCWGDALGFAYARVGCADSSFPGRTANLTNFPASDLPMTVGARWRDPDTLLSIGPFQKPYDANDEGGDR
jgi:hypothetical protein